MLSLAVCEELLPPERSPWWIVKTGRQLGANWLPSGTQMGANWHDTRL